MAELTKNDYATMWNDIMKQSSEQHSWNHFKAHKLFTETLSNRVPSWTLTYREKYLVSVAIFATLNGKEQSNV